MIYDIPPFPFFSLQYGGTNLVQPGLSGIRVTYWETSNRLPWPPRWSNFGRLLEY